MFGPAARFPYADDRSYTPPDAPLEKYLGMLDAIGFARGVLVQGSAHGHDNSAMLDALAQQPDRLRGVAVADADVAPADLREWNRLGVRGLRFNHFFRDGQLHYRGGVPLSAAQTLAPVMAELGWHLQLWIDVKDLPETIPVLKSLGLPVVIDHMGRTDARAGTGTAGFQSLLRAVGDGWCWAKLSGAHRLSRDAPDYPDARPFHEALVRANPERLVWGGDWPHPRVEGEMPDAGHLFELFQTWTPDLATQHRILVTNPAKLYGFPELKVAATMSVNNKRVFYVKYLAARDLCRHPAGAARRAARPARERKPDEISAPILAAAHAYQIGAARDELARALSRRCRPAAARAEPADRLQQRRGLRPRRCRGLHGGGRAGRQPVRRQRPFGRRTCAGDAAHAVETHHRGRPRAAARGRMSTATP